MANDDKQLTDGPIWRGLTVMSAPMVLGILAVLSVGLADAYFLGKLGGAPLAAVGFIYPVTAAITSLSIGLSAGANAAVSQAIGREDDATATARIGLHAVALGVFLAVGVAFLLFLMIGPLFGVLGASDNVMTEIRAFVPWWCLSFPFAVTSMLINALFRAHGNARISAIFMVSESVLNIALTPLLVFGWAFIPGFETAGAAMATFAARAVVATAAFVWAMRRGLIFFNCQPTKNFLQSARTLVKVGGPAAFSNAINPAGMAAVTAAVATVGETAVAGFGAATRIQSLALVPMFALSSGIGPVVGQNWGAEQHDRAGRAVQVAFAFCAAYGIAIGLILAFFAEGLAGFIASGGEATSYAAQYLRIVGMSLFGYGFIVTANAAMNARSKAGYSMALSLTRIFVLYLPLAWVGVSLFGYTGILIAAVCANVLGAACAVYAVNRTELFKRDNLAQTFA
ncbi:putative efflux protein, MATE family [Cognatiyoonia koreensis]|uniref:Putative efflux protein, MATE family n=1 Tax=Cognatiyoonia koreensis TaxID=364200 RepID=A0A1I0NI94_9RHOB|nr:MATE family efflux transporter [Cognatiyoonia koreensis]SEW01227.1 putative efflux protein, MATE family [Cognatiyoonia koreensis]